MFHQVTALTCVLESYLQLRGLVEEAPPDMAITQFVVMDTDKERMEAKRTSNTTSFLLSPVKL